MSGILLQYTKEVSQRQKEIRMYNNYLKELKGQKLPGGFVITKPLNFVISAVIAAALSFAAVMYLIVAIATSNPDGTPEGYKRIYDPELVGCYTLVYKYGDGTPVFELTTPRGVEKVVGTENLQHSLDVYRSSGIYGLPHVEVIDPSEEVESK